MVGWPRAAWRSWMLLAAMSVAADAQSVRPLGEDTSSTSHKASDLKAASARSVSATEKFESAAKALREVLPGVAAPRRTKPDKAGQDTHRRPTHEHVQSDEDGMTDAQRAAAEAKREAFQQAEVTAEAKNEALSALDKWKVAAAEEKAAAKKATVKAHIAAADINAKAAMTISKAEHEANHLRAEALRENEKADGLRAKATTDTRRIDEIQKQLNKPDVVSKPDVVEQKANKVASAKAAVKAAAHKLHLLKKEAEAAQKDHSDTVKAAAKSKASAVKRKMDAAQKEFDAAKKELEQHQSKAKDKAAQKNDKASAAVKKAVDKASNDKTKGDKAAKGDKAKAAKPAKPAAPAKPAKAAAAPAQPKASKGDQNKANKNNVKKSGGA